MGWIAGLKTERRLDEVTPHAVWRKLIELAEDGEFAHFVDRILDPELSQPKPPKGASPAATKLSGGRPSTRRAAS
jgi:hypothetical protein